MFPSPSLDPQTFYPINASNSVLRYRILSSKLCPGKNEVPWVKFYLCQKVFELETCRFSHIHQIFGEKATQMFG